MPDPCELERATTVNQEPEAAGLDEPLDVSSQVSDAPSR